MSGEQEKDSDKDTTSLGNYIFDWREPPSLQRMAKNKGVTVLYASAAYSMGHRVSIVEARANDSTRNHFGHVFRYRGTYVA